MSILEVQGLKMYYKSQVGGEFLRAVDDVSFSLKPGESLGLVGESGCGKTSVGFSILRVLPRNGRIAGGRVILNGRNLLELPDEDMRKIRWKEISMVFQNAMNALNPVFRIENTLMEALRFHERVSKGEARKKILELFDLVGLDPSLMKSYPHQLSGGMKQRIMIVMGMLCNPKIMILDEPTTALDVVVQYQILRKIKELQEKLNFATIVISHDISVITEICYKLGVMYGGEIVEYGDIVSVFKKPLHPYTMGLLRTFPSIHGAMKRLVSIPGSPPDLRKTFRSCRFAPRCPAKEEICEEKVPPIIGVENDHYSKCHFVESFTEDTGAAIWKM